VIADPGYQGTFAITPRKKPKGGELSVGDKRNNKTISSIRSAVERCIGRVAGRGFTARLPQNRA
jgi:hypothetical protein